MSAAPASGVDPGDTPRTALGTGNDGLLNPGRSEDVGAEGGGCTGGGGEVYGGATAGRRAGAGKSFAADGNCSDHDRAALLSRACVRRRTAWRGSGRPSTRWPKPRARAPLLARGWLT